MAISLCLSPFCPNSQVGGNCSFPGRHGGVEVAPTLRYDKPVVEGDQIAKIDQIAKVGAPGPGGHGHGRGLDQHLVCMVSIGRGQQRAEPAVVCGRCEEMGLLLKDMMVRALKLLSLWYLSWKARDAR